MGTPAPRAAGLSLKRLERISFAVGILLLGWLLYRIGLSTLVRNFSALGWGFLVVLALHGLPVFLNSLAWQRVLPAGRRVRLRDLAPMQVAGDAVNAVNPLGVVGGELMRASLLSRILPAPEAVASVGLVAMAQFVSQILFVLSGMPVALAWITDPKLRRGLLLLCALLAMLLALVLLLAWSQSALEWIGRRLGRIPWLKARWVSVPERWKSLEAELVSVLRKRPGPFGAAVAASFLDWQVGVLEALLILHFLHQPVGWAQAYAIEVLSVTIEGVLFFVPAKMGAQEGGKVLIFLAMGLDPGKGLALGLTRRLVQLFWAGVGLAILGRSQRRTAA
jgi:uncharacterized protein (TIRG00374 family)